MSILPPLVDQGLLSSTLSLPVNRVFYVRRPRRTPSPNSIKRNELFSFKLLAAEGPSPHFTHSSVSSPSQAVPHIQV